LPDAPALARAIATPAPRRRIWLGLALLLLSALMFALHNTLARLAYDEGVSPTTVNAARTSAVLLMFVLVFGTKGQWPRLPRAAWLLFAITAVCYALHNPLLLIAFKFIPVSLAVLVLYIYPLAGAPRSSLGMNAEPVITVLLAVSILGETLGWMQLVGAALIIGALAVHAVIDLKFGRL
jgi:drug/metabolite transporter (DMT)-like permease